MANELQVPRLLHQLVRKTHIGIATRCRQCSRDRDVNTMCQECPEKPWLCSTICFERYHQRMHPELYPSLLPIFSPSVLRTREGQSRIPSRFQRALEPSAEGRRSPRLHQRILNRFRDDQAPRRPCYLFVGQNVNNAGENTPQ